MPNSSLAYGSAPVKSVSGRPVKTGGPWIGPVRTWVWPGEPPAPTMNGTDAHGWPEGDFSSSISQVDSAAGATNDTVCGPAPVMTRPTYWRLAPVSCCRNIPASCGDEG